MNKLAVLLVLLFVPTVAFADGGIIPDYYTHFYETNQKAVITWDGSTESMTLATDFSADSLGNMAWIIPVRSSVKPVVAAGNASVFWAFVDYFVPPRASGSGFGGGLGATKAAGVEVVDIKKVDIYDVTILKTTDARSLTDWLNANGYYVSADYVPVLGRYVGGDSYFIANRIDLKNKYAAEIAEAKKFNSSFENLTLDDQKGVLSGIIYGDNVAYSTDLGALRNALYDLKAGVATPLKVTFSPPAPSFPLVISSLSNGSDVFTGDFLIKGAMRIDVYVAAPTAVNDSGGVLQFDKALTITDSFRSEVKDYIDLGGAKVITRLTYFGGPGGLTADASFVPCSDCSVEDMKAQQDTDTFLSSPVVVCLLFAGIFAIFFSPAFVLGLTAIYVQAKKFKKKLSWQKAALLGYAVGAFLIAVLFQDVSLALVLAFHGAVTFYGMSFLSRKWKRKYWAFIAAYACASIASAAAMFVLLL